MVAASTVALLAVAGTARAGQGTPSVPDLTVRQAAQDLVLPSGVTVHTDLPQIVTVANEFPEIWKEGGFADVP